MRLPARIPALRLIPLVILLSGCASANMSNVRAFADATGTVTGATESVSADMVASCERRKDLVEEYVEITKAQVSAVNCTAVAAVTKAILASNQLLQDYAQALGALAQDSYASFTPEETDLKTVLDDANKFGANLTDREIKRVGDLAQFLASQVTKLQRQKELKAAMTGETADQAKALMSVLKKLGTTYGGLIQAEGNQAEVISLAIETRRPSEPIAVAEFVRRVRILRQGQLDKIQSSQDYVASIDAMSKAFDKAADDLTRASNETISSEISAFVRQARRLQASLRKAFAS